MGQYHNLINLTDQEYLNPYPLGNMAKAWEQVTGGIPAALAALLAAAPGNMPADLGHHPMVGRWAGQRIAVIGDYTERGDIKLPEGCPPADKLYGLCREMPVLEKYKPRWYHGKLDGSCTITEREPFEVRYPIRGRKSGWKYDPPERQLARSLRKYKQNCGKYAPLADLSESLTGLIEEALSIRFCGEYSYAVPVKPYAVKGKDGEAHYVLADSVLRDSDGPMSELWVMWRMLNLGGHHGGPAPDPYTLPAFLDRWPWDRAPRDLSFHNVTVAQADEGQHRVFVNLDKGEFFDPAQMGEQPTLAGIMRASDGCGVKRMAMDTVIADGVIESNVRTGGAPDGGTSSGVGSASALFCMLLHPEPRGGGDIDRESFPEVGRWRGDRIALTAERHSLADPTDLTTDEARASFTDISPLVSESLCKLASD